ncbi:MAG: PQQ-binding-like beta-propeller repeat protein [Planctomycetes bacterium]|jgi:outer membrane protein assembly factor BamB|nr:PQQ-binding-like beta-propeller repeat protein [Planctomycetota bacterium]
MSADTRANLIFVGTHGHVRALDKHTGAEVWTTSLPGTAYSLVILLCEDGIVFAGANGKLFALHPSSGEILWRNELPGLRYGPMTLATTTAATNPLPLIVEDQRQRSD